MLKATIPLLQVQTENGDVGLIVNTVLDRVSKQTEAKDLHILTMLQDKDSEIAALRNEVSTLTHVICNYSAYITHTVCSWKCLLA